MKKRKIDRKKSKSSRFIPKDTFIRKGDNILLYNGYKYVRTFSQF